MRLGDLLADELVLAAAAYTDAAALAAVTISGLADDSRLLQPGEAFLAYPGSHADGRAYIAAAIERGAAAVLYDPVAAPELPSTQLPLLPVPHLSRKCSKLAARFYDFPADSLNIVGFTGTNGKSSCVHFYAQLSTALQQRCWQLGTLGAGFTGSLQSTGLTTPGPLLLQRVLAQARAAHASRVAMEVSSHAIAQQRIAGLNFFVQALTQVGQDHLDYHGSQANYAACKSGWLAAGSGFRVLNLDDAVGLSLAQQLLGSGKLLAYAQQDAVVSTAVNASEHQHKQDFINKDQSPILFYRVIEQTAQGITIEWSGPWGQAQVQLALHGAFQASNITAVLLVLLAQGHAWADIIRELPKLTAPPGRMQCLQSTHGLRVFIDYAHTADALAAALSSLRACPHANLWCIVGCGGDRDKSKRPLMAAAAEQGADRVILTADNPRHEQVQDILDMMRNGLVAADKVIFEADRAMAIAEAVAGAADDDIILLAGKGHEALQLVGDKQLPFDEVALVRAALDERDVNAS